MLLHIVARGKIGRSPEAELVQRYLKRIAWPTRVTELPERGGNSPTLPGNSVSVALDERGQALSSMELAKNLEAWRDEGKREGREIPGVATPPTAPSAAVQTLQDDLPTCAQCGTALSETPWPPSI